MLTGIDMCRIEGFIVCSVFKHSMGMLYCLSGAAPELLLGYLEL